MNVDRIAVGSVALLDASVIRWIPFQKVDVKAKDVMEELGGTSRTPKRVRGYIGLSIFGETQIWTRVD